MGKPTEEAIIEAIKGSAGIVSTVAKRLGVAWHTANGYCKSSEATKQAFKDEREKLVDLAEGVLVKSIKNGDQQNAKWVLSRLGKNRGYVERTETTGADGGPIKTSQSIDLSALSPDELAELLRLQKKAGIDSADTNEAT